MNKIVVSDYDPDWPNRFELLRSKFASIVGEMVVVIEHVGSTSVPGLAAKPIIDLDIVVAPEDRTQAIERLILAGYEHRGDLGVEGRDAFDHPPHAFPYHLYLCTCGSLGLRNHLVIRDALRSNPELAVRYSRLKQRLALEYAHDINQYIDGKTEFLLDILRNSELNKQELRSIESSNRA